VVRSRETDCQKLIETVKNYDGNQIARVVNSVVIASISDTFRVSPPLLPILLKQVSRDVADTFSAKIAILVSDTY